MKRIDKRARESLIASDARISRRRQGMCVWLVGLVVAILVAIVGAIFGSQ
jgi:hypothetical protein